MPKTTNLVEGKYGTGFVPEKVRPTNRVFAAASAEPVNWYAGFDIEVELRRKLGSNFSLIPNDQKQTLSCVGQSWSKYAGVRKVMIDNNPNWVDFSARDVYSHCYLPNGGAFLLDAGLFCRNKGVAPEEQVPSKPMDEQTMRDKLLEDQGFPDAYTMVRRLVNGGSIDTVMYPSPDNIAKAIRDNGGCIIAVGGENNGSWLTEFPQPPEKIQWGHAIYAGKFRNVNGKKQIGILNSWGSNCGKNGWQWLDESYVNDKFILGAMTWSPETLYIQRFSDYEKIYQFIQNNKIVDEQLEPVWKNILAQTNLKIKYGDYYDYCQIKKLI